MSLKRCPFCGTKDNLHVLEYTDKWSVECWTCGATGPLGYYSATARKLWNRAKSVNPDEMPRPAFSAAIRGRSRST
jgi:Lar family restriction alleviation protein